MVRGLVHGVSFLGWSAALLIVSDDKWCGTGVKRGLCWGFLLITDRYSSLGSGGSLSGV